MTPLQLDLLAEVRWLPMVVWPDRSAVTERTFSASTDVRAWWPACEKYEPKR